MLNSALIQTLLSSADPADTIRAHRILFLEGAARSREWDGSTRPGPLDPRFFDVELPDLPDEEGIEGG